MDFLRCNILASFTFSEDALNSIIKVIFSTFVSIDSNTRRYTMMGSKIIFKYINGTFTYYERVWWFIWSVQSCFFVWLCLSETFFCLFWNKVKWRKCKYVYSQVKLSLEKFCVCEKKFFVIFFLFWCRENWISRIYNILKKKFHVFENMYLLIPNNIYCSFLFKIDWGNINLIQGGAWNKS